MLLLRTEYRLDADGGFTRTQRHRYRVLTQEGVDGWGAAEARWSPWYMERPQITATVTSPAGEEVKLDPSTIAESAAYPLDARCVQRLEGAARAAAARDDRLCRRRDHRHANEAALLGTPRIA